MTDSCDLRYLKILELADQIERNAVEHEALGWAVSDLRIPFSEHLRLVAEACRAVDWNDVGAGGPDGGQTEYELMKRILGLP